jgi:serine protease inhibitor
MNAKQISMLLIIFFILFIGCKETKPSITEPTNGDTDTPVDFNKINAEVVQTNNEFGLRLFKTINETSAQSNIFISPLSVSIALGMAINGANGTTKDEIISMLNLNGLSQEAINETYQQLIKLLISNEEKVLFEIANSIWYDQNRMIPEQNFLDVNQTYFFADVRDIDFSQPSAVDSINNWISEETHGKIEDMLDSIPGSAVLYLINALYFYGQWLYTFDKDNTKEQDFYLLNGSTVRCPLMSQKSEYHYYANDQMQVIDMPYANKDYSMTLVLPNYETDINTLVNGLSVEEWNSWIGQFGKDSVTVYLPKFKTEYKRLLNDDLKALGMQIAFTPDADFSGIAPNREIWISRVLHKAFIEINEEGSEAAAATIIEIIETSIPMHPEMYINRPFFFVIREHKSNTILFMGKIANPLE